MSFEAKCFRHIAVTILQVCVSCGVAASSCQQGVEPQQQDVAHNENVVGRRGGQPPGCGLGFGRITVGGALEQCLHQNARRKNSPSQQLSLADQMLDRVAHGRYGGVVMSMPSYLPGQIHLDKRQVGEVMLVAEEYVADVGQELPSAVTFRSRLAVHQRKAQCHLRVGQREIVGGSLGSVQGILDLAHRWIIGLERAGVYPC